MLCLCIFIHLPCSRQRPFTADLELNDDVVGQLRAPHRRNIRREQQDFATWDGQGQPVRRTMGCVKMFQLMQMRHFVSGCSSSVLPMFGWPPEPRVRQHGNPKIPSAATTTLKLPHHPIDKPPSIKERLKPGHIAQNPDVTTSLIYCVPLVVNQKQS